MMLPQVIVHSVIREFLGLKQQCSSKQQVRNIHNSMIRQIWTSLNATLELCYLSCIDMH